MPPQDPFIVTLGAALSGMLLGVLIAMLLSASRLRALRSAFEERLSGREQRISELTAERAEWQQTAETVRSEAATMAAEKAALETRIEEEAKAAEEKLALLHEAESRLLDTFKALSGDALQLNNRAFLDLATATLEKFQQGAQADLESRGKTIGELVRPLQDALQRLDTSVQAMEHTRAEAYAGVREQVRSLAESQEKLRTETANLVQALRSPTVRGRWGEIQLRRVVELAGMVDHCDFYLQAHAEGEQGRVRPDMLVRLPNNREIVVDAKVSMQAYLDALGTQDETAKRSKLKEHAAQVRQHLTRLSSKAYWNQFSAAPEFVVAFLPGETFFSAALEQDPSLIEFGVEHQVILATPTTLIALLKAVAYGWRQEKMAESAMQVSALGSTLYERLRVFAGHLERLRQNLQRSVESYNQAAASLETRVFPSARRFRELGAAEGDEIATLDPIDVSPRALQSAPDTRAEDEETVE